MGGEQVVLELGDPARRVRRRCDGHADPSNGARRTVLRGTPKSRVPARRCTERRAYARDGGGGGHQSLLALAGRARGRAGLAGRTPGCSDRLRASCSGSCATEGREGIHRMIYLHKILPLFVLPVGITLLLVLAGLRLRRRGLIWSGMAVLGLSSTPFI